MAEHAARVRENSRQFRILQALSQTPRDWFTAPHVLSRVAALAVGAHVGRGGLYNVLGDLEKAGLVDAKNDAVPAERKPAKVYRISEKGRQILKATAPDTFPWPSGHEVKGLRATYRVREPFPYSGRGLMFVAEVSDVRAADVLPSWVARGARVIIKTVRPIDSAVADSARYLYVVNETLDRELPTLERLVNLEHVVDTVDSGAVNVMVGKSMAQQRPLPVRFIVQRRLEGCQHLSAYLRRHRLSAAQWWQWATALAKGLRSVHSLGTVHRDIRPENIVIARRAGDGRWMPIFVDIGEAIFRKVGRPASPDTPRPLELFTAPEQRGAQIRPSRRADLYSLGAVLFYMVKGAPPDFLVSGEDALKEQVARALRFDGSIVFDDFGIADVISRCLGFDPEKRIQSADELLDDLSVRAPLDESPAALVNTTQALMDELIGRRNGVLLSLAAVELQRLNERLEGMAGSRGMLVIEGSRETIVRRLSTCIATLGAGSRYVAKTVPRFWWPVNLGIRSRYLSENIELVRRGAHVQRMLVLTPDDRVDPLVHEVVRAHLEMEADCARLPRPRGTIETRYVEVPAEDRARIVQRGEQRGIWISDESAVSLIPAYDSNGVIRALTLTQSDRGERDRLVREFEDSFRSAESHPLSEWATA